MSTLAAIPIWDDVDVDRFRAEIAPQNRPAVLRGLVGRWPAVQKGKRSPQDFIDYLLRFDAGHPIRALRADPSIKGRFFYREDMRGLNFERRPETFRSALSSLLALTERTPWARIDFGVK